MNLEKYWRVLANPAEIGNEWRFYRNGWFSSNFQGNLTLYDQDGKLFTDCDFEQIVALEDGCIAICEDCGNRWKVYNQQHEKVAIWNIPDTYILPNGLVYQETPEDETFIFPYGKEEQKVSLGYDIIDIVGRPENLFAYKQRSKHNIFIWRICKFENGKIELLRMPFNAENIFFFDNDSYAVFSKDNMMRVYNCSGHKIFACNVQKTRFVKVGSSYFWAYNGMRYRGIYSAEDGKLVRTCHDISHYFDNGAVATDNSLSFDDNSNQIITKIYNLQPFGKFGAFFMYRTQAYVIDTELTFDELRQRALSELQWAAKHDLNYARYLAQLMQLLC